MKVTTSKDDFYDKSNAEFLNSLSGFQGLAMSF